MSRSVNVQTLITSEEDGRLARMASITDRSKSATLRSALIAYLEQFEASGGFIVKKEKRRGVRAKDRAKS